MLPLEDSRLLKSARSSVAAPSPLQAKPPSTPRVHSTSTPSSAYQAYRQGERDSYSASKPKPAAHPHLPSGHISSSPRPAVKKESEWSPADEKLAIRRVQNTITPAKPAKPLVTKEDDARETRRFHNQIAAAPPPGKQPKPATGSAGDLAAATKASQDASKALADFRKDHTLSNRGGLRQESEMALRQADNVANKRYAAAKAAKAAQDAPAAIPTSLNRGGVRQEAISDARREASSARTTYLNSQGLDSSGKPIVVTPPKPPAPAKPENKSFWDNATDFVKDHAKDIGHGALDAAGFIPVVGAAADLANAGWYLAEGDKVNAALSAVAAIPGAGDAVAATAIAGKVAVKGAKAIEGAAKAEKGIEALSGGKDVLKVLHREGGISRASLEKELERSNWVKTSWDSLEKPRGHVFWTNPARTESVRISKESQARVYNSPGGGTVKLTDKPQGGWREQNPDGTPGKTIVEQALKKDGKPGPNSQTHFPLR